MKKVIGLEDLDYEEKLKAVKLPNLEYGCLRGDMMEVFKILLT